MTKEGSPQEEGARFETVEDSDAPTIRASARAYD